MASMTAECKAACAALIAGMVSTLNLGAQPSADLLNRLANHDSSTCQIVFDESYSCSGALINSTTDQGRPLILTAAHCLEGKQDLTSIVVIFGRRKLLRDQPFKGLGWVSHGGARLLASSPELDFALLQLAEEIPSYLAPVYLGWSHEIAQPVVISTIHFPDLGEAQYSFSITGPSLATYGGLYHAVDFGHWKVDQWTQGSTALGSSGAPLLNSRFEIIGGLSGSTDWDNHSSDYFFRFDLAYDHFSRADKQLKIWIDPANSGRTGPYRPTHKIRNYSFTSAVAETLKLSPGAKISEEFRLRENSRINGVYVSVAAMSSHSDATIHLSLSQNGSVLSLEKTDADFLTPFSENYIPFVTPLVLSGKLSVALRFESPEPSAYIAIPRSGTGESVSHLLALNSSKAPP